MTAPAVKRVAATLALVLLALLAGMFIWRHYFVALWTRDARVSAVVIQVAPDVAGQLVQMPLHDNEQVQQGSLLFVIDPARYRLQLQQAEADLAQYQATLKLKQNEARRRQHLGRSISHEELEQAQAAAASARAAVAVAQAQLATARLNLARTQVFAPASGSVTHLQSHAGDYARVGQPVLSLVEDSAFWVDAYFKETQIHRIHPGERARIHLLGSDRILQGHVQGIGRGVANSNSEANAQGLPSVAPTFDWVRLAQRLPVRIELDKVPPGLLLSTGMSASVEILPGKK